MDKDEILGRSAQLKYLTQFYEKQGSHLIVLYGKKGVGKTALLKKFCEGKPYWYYEARPCSEREQAYQWGRELDLSAEYPEYDKIMKLIAAGNTEKKVIVVDEFQYLIKGGREFMTSLVRLLHGDFGGSPALVVLSSSSIGWVENNMVTKIGPAALEISGFLKIKELEFAELFTYFKRYTMQECVETYAVLGGLPGLWQCFSEEKSVRENICGQILAPSGAFRNYVKEVVTEELRETGVYYTILAALAAGREKLNDLYLHTGFSRAKISVYLKNLIELEIVEKAFSLDSDGRENTKKGIYRISSPLIHFYFRYLYPNQSSMWRMEPEEFYEFYVAPDYARFASLCFPSVCAQYLELLNQSGALKHHYTRSGEWIGKEGTIDYAALDESGRGLLAGCEYLEPVFPYGKYEKLLETGGQAKLEASEIYLFAEKGFDARLAEEAKKDEKVHLIEWRNLYI